MTDEVRVYVKRIDIIFKYRYSKYVRIATKNVEIKFVKIQILSKYVK